MRANETRGLETGDETMKNNTQEYRGYKIVRLPRRWVVLNKCGSQVAAFSTLSAAKTQIDRFVDPTDASDYGCPI